MVELEKTSVLIGVISMVVIVFFLRKKKQEYDYVKSFLFRSKGLLFEIVHLELKGNPNITKEEIEKEFLKRYPLKKTTNE